MKHIFFLTASFFLGQALAGGGGSGIHSQLLPLDFGGISVQGELLLPAGSTSAPLVLLIQGTGPEDRNGSFVTANGVTPGSFGKLAVSLAHQGFAVMRYDKRYAAQTFNSSTAQQAYMNYSALTMQDLLSDARSALRAAQHQPGVDPRNVFIYGWSEGSVVAAALAQEIDARGLIVQGPVVDSFAATFTNQFNTVGMTYLSRYAVDGKIDLAGVMQALTGPGSDLAKMQASLLLSLNSTFEQPRLAATLDTNHDGKLDLELEVQPKIPGLYQGLTASSPLYAPATTLPTLGQLAPKLHLPLLILQGENDGNVSAAYARQLDDALTSAGHQDHTLKLYAGLGHSLGGATSITQDNFALMAEQPINDLVSWLKKRVDRAPTDRRTSL